MHLNRLIIIIFITAICSCSNKKSIREASNSTTPPPSQQETEEVGIPDYVTQSGQVSDNPAEKTGEEVLGEGDALGKQEENEQEKASSQIIDIKLEGLINDQDNELEANTNIAAIKAIFSDNSVSDVNVEFKLLETGETDYNLFEIAGSSILNKEALVGNRRFVLNISAGSGESIFEKTVIFSVSAGEIPPESPQNILFQPASMIGEDKLVGSFLVVDDERFEHTISFSETTAESENANDNSLFDIVGDKLYISDTFVWKESFTIKVEAHNIAYEELKNNTEISFSIAEPEEEAEIVITTITLDPTRYPSNINEYPCNTKVLNAWPTDSATYIFNNDCAVNPWKCALTGVPFDSATTGLIGKFNGDCPALCIDNPSCEVALGDISGGTCYLHTDMSMWTIRHDIYDLGGTPVERYSLTRICRQN